jgi:hypothetical protein
LQAFKLVQAFKLLLILWHMLIVPAHSITAACADMTTNF